MEDHVRLEYMLRHEGRVQKGDLCHGRSIALRQGRARGVQAAAATGRSQTMAVVSELRALRRCDRTVRRGTIDGRIHSNDEQTGDMD